MFLVEQFENISVRFLKAPNGEPVIIAADLIAALKGDKTNSADLVKKYVRSKWWIDLPNPNGGRNVRCLFEPGAYQLAGNPMFQTDFAENFQDWLYEGVLPKLRSQGFYISRNDDETLALKNRIDNLEFQLRELQLSDDSIGLQKMFNRFTERNPAEFVQITATQWLETKLPKHSTIFKSRFQRTAAEIYRISYQKPPEDLSLPFGVKQTTVGINSYQLPRDIAILESAFETVVEWCKKDDSSMTK